MITRTRQVRPLPMLLPPYPNLTFGRRDKVECGRLTDPSAVRTSLGPIAVNTLLGANWPYFGAGRRLRVISAKDPAVTNKTAPTKVSTRSHNPASEFSQGLAERRLSRYGVLTRVGGLLPSHVWPPYPSRKLTRGYFAEATSDANRCGAFGRRYACCEVTRTSGNHRSSISSYRQLYTERATWRFKRSDYVSETRSVPLSHGDEVVSDSPQAVQRSCRYVMLLAALSSSAKSIEKTCEGAGSIQPTLFNWRQLRECSGHRLSVGLESIQLLPGDAGNQL